jgi:hypothetical protein
MRSAISSTSFAVCRPRASRPGAAGTGEAVYAGFPWAGPPAGLAGCHGAEAPAGRADDRAAWSAWGRSVAITADTVLARAIETAQHRDRRVEAGRRGDRAAPRPQHRDRSIETAASDRSIRPQRTAPARPADPPRRKPDEWVAVGQSTARTPTGIGREIGDAAPHWAALVTSRPIAADLGRQFRRANRTNHQVPGAYEQRGIRPWGASSLSMPHYGPL